MMKRREIAHIFNEMRGRKVIWYKRDKENWHKQHHEHEEYRDINGIQECLKNPDQINQQISKKGKDKGKLIYYRDRGSFLYSKWHKVIIKVCGKWDSEDINNHKKLAILITTMYVEKINVFSEEKVWP